MEHKGLSSILIKLTKGTHTHNGVERHVGDEFRVSADVAVSKLGRGECLFVTGKALQKEIEDRKAKAAAAEAKAKNKKGK